MFQFSFSHLNIHSFDFAYCCCSKIKWPESHIMEISLTILIQVCFDQLKDIEWMLWNCKTTEERKNTNTEANKLLCTDFFEWRQNICVYLFAIPCSNVLFYTEKNCFFFLFAWSVFSNSFSVYICWQYIYLAIFRYVFNYITYTKLRLQIVRECV